MKYVFKINQNDSKMSFLSLMITALSFETSLAGVTYTHIFFFHYNEVVNEDFRVKSGTLLVVVIFYSFR
jgi:hypothetical protein